MKNKKHAKPHYKPEPKDSSKSSKPPEKKEKYKDEDKKEEGRVSFSDFFYVELRENMLKRPEKCFLCHEFKAD